MKPRFSITWATCRLTPKWPQSGALVNPSIVDPPCRVRSFELYKKYDFSCGDWMRFFSPGDHKPAGYQDDGSLELEGWSVTTGQPSPLPLPHHHVASNTVDVVSPEPITYAAKRWVQTVVTGRDGCASYLNFFCFMLWLRKHSGVTYAPVIWKFLFYALIEKAHWRDWCACYLKNFVLCFDWEITAAWLMRLFFIWNIFFFFLYRQSDTFLHASSSYRLRYKFIIHKKRIPLLHHIKSYSQ